MTDERLTEAIRVRMPPSLLRAIEEQAKRERRSVSAMARILMQRAITSCVLQTASDKV